MSQKDVTKEELLTQLPFWLETDTEGFQYASWEPEDPGCHSLAIRGKFVSLNSAASLCSPGVRDWLPVSAKDILLTAFCTLHYSIIVLVTL